MHSKKVTVTNETGLHARPAAEFSKAASDFDADIFVDKIGSGQAKVNAKSVVNVMSLHIEKGTEIEISAEGLDEMVAVENLVALINKGFGEN